MDRILQITSEQTNSRDASQASFTGVAPPLAD